MEFYRFDKEVGKNISHSNSDFIMSRIVETDKPTRIACMHLKANGIVGFHQAVTPQLLIIVDGEGWVRGDDELKVNIKANDVVFLKRGEGHETATSTGLTAIVIESEELTPANFMPFKEHK